MEEDRSKRIRDRLQHMSKAMDELLERNCEGASRYEQAGRFGRWLIRHREPQVFEQYQVVQGIQEHYRAIESVQEAKRSAYANEGQEIVI
jgi:hypothetical protein